MKLFVASIIPGGGTLTLPEDLGVQPMKISCNVRNLYGCTRQAYEVILTTPGGIPYDPQQFPIGIWKITGTSWQSRDKFNANTYGPVKILTNAHQMVYRWELDQHGDYLNPTTEKVDDTCYWLHWSTSSTTLGCIRLNSENDARVLGTIVDKLLASKEEISLEVRR